MKLCPSRVQYAVAASVSGLCFPSMRRKWELAIFMNMKSRFGRQN